MHVSYSLLPFLTSLRPAAAKPDNCCCLLNSAHSQEKFCTRNGGTCVSDSECQTGETTTTTTTTTTTQATGGPGGCNSAAPAGGPKVAMAWVSDQYANFDREWSWENDCTNPSDPTDAESNQFKCCHDWLVDPSSFAGINTVSLAFLKPTEILDPSTCSANACTDMGVRAGMPGAIEYFYSTVSLVFVSVGGATYTDSWHAVLASNATAEDFATKVAAIAVEHDVGVEIDYEESSSPRLPQLEAFVKKYREILPYDDGTGVDPPPRSSFLTIDFGQGAQFMGPIANWVAKYAFDPDPSRRWLNWANAMVSGSRQSRTSDLIKRWSQHIHGYSTLQNAPIAPAYLVGGIWSSGRSVQDNCVDSSSISLTDPEIVDFVNNVQPCVDGCGDCEKGALAEPPAGSYTMGMLGYAYWMVGNVSPSQSNTCPKGVNFRVYDTPFEGDGDCTPGFVAAADAHGIQSQVDWTSRVY